MKNRKADIRFSSGGRGQPRRGRLTPGERDGNFRCAHCGQQVVFDPLISGVKNRNHCPHCLWSRHVDLNRPGDRLAECKGGMRPIGLTLKRSRNKYARERDGEVMLIHQCAECGKLSINRIAADDNEALILQTLEESPGSTRHCWLRLRRARSSRSLPPIKSLCAPRCLAALPNKN
jgi:DNA-directed RNA polymerase subunit RPC12/RpoP